MNTQKPLFSAKNTPNCIRIWNHTQKYYDLKSRQALPDGVFGHFNARKSYPFILLQNRRLENCSKTHSKDPRFHPKPSQKSISKMQKKNSCFFNFRLLDYLSSALTVGYTIFDEPCRYYFAVRFQKIF